MIKAGRREFYGTFYINNFCAIFMQDLKRQILEKVAHAEVNLASFIRRIGFFFVIKAPIRSPYARRRISDKPSFLDKSKLAHEKAIFWRMLFGSYKRFSVAFPDFIKSQHHFFFLFFLESPALLKAIAIACF